MNVLFVGNSGFPFGLAAVEKQKIIAKGLVENGNSVKVICTEGEHSEKMIPRKGDFEGIEYYYTSIFTYQKNNILLRKVNKYLGAISEPFVLLFSKCDVIVALSRNYFVMCEYKLISKIKGIPLTMLVHEDNTFIKNKRFSLKSLNQLFYNKYIWNMVDAVFPISSYLEELIKTKNPCLKQFPLPSLTDFEFINNVQAGKMGKYFLFCGGAGYYEIIEFIIKSFELTESKNYTLTLVSSGSVDQINRINARIKKSTKPNKIKIVSFLPYNELIAYYKSSAALLIPLRNSIQDIARFPHKIAEYCAAGSPIITTKYGEPAKFLKHNKTALISENYTPLSFSKQMIYVIENPEIVRVIGNNSLNEGKNMFDYKSKINSLSNFLKEL